MLRYVLSALLTAPGLAVVGTVAAVLGVVGGAWGRRRSWLDRLAVGLLVSYGVVAARIELLPAAGLAHGRPFGVCDFAHWFPLGPEHWLEPSAASLLLWLMVPAALLAVLPDPTRRPITIASVFAVPAVVELVQALVPWLGRDCSTLDLVNAELGVLLGTAVGLVVAIALTPLRGSRGRRARQPEGTLEALFDEG